MIEIKNPNLCLGCPNFSTIGCCATACPKDNLAAVTATTSTNTGGWRIRAERTCKMKYSGGVPDFVSLDTWTCTECGSPIYNDCEPSYCEYCGSKVVSE